MEVIVSLKGLKGITELAAKLNYASAEKMYRIGRHPNAKPSFDIIADLTNLFEDLNVRWLLTGKGTPFDDRLDEKTGRSVPTELTEHHTLKIENKRLKNENDAYLKIIENLSRAMADLGKGYSKGTLDVKKVIPDAES